MHLLMAESDCPEATLSGLQDVKIHLLIPVVQKISSRGKEGKK